VRIALKQKDPRIVPDMGVRVSFLEKPQDPAAAAAAPKAVGVLVPADAVVQRTVDGKDTDAVFVVEQGKAVLTPVKPGESRGSERVIETGLAPGDSVVQAPPADLQDGAEVREKTAQ